MFGKKIDEDAGRAAGRTIEDRAIQRVLEAASARPDELPQPSRAFTTRVLAHAKEAARTSERDAHPFGAVAWHLLPALAVLVVVLAGTASWQTRDAEQRRVETIATLATSQGEGDLMLAVVFLGGDAPETREDAR